MPACVYLAPHLTSQTSRMNDCCKIHLAASISPSPWCLINTGRQEPGSKGITLLTSRHVLGNIFDVTWLSPPFHLCQLPCHPTYSPALFVSPPCENQQQALCNSHQDFVERCYQHVRSRLGPSGCILGASPWELGNSHQDLAITQANVSQKGCRTLGHPQHIAKTKGRQVSPSIAKQQHSPSISSCSLLVPIDLPQVLQGNCCTSPGGASSQELLYTTSCILHPFLLHHPTTVHSCCLAHLSKHAQPCRICSAYPKQCEGPSPKVGIPQSFT